MAAIRPFAALRYDPARAGDLSRLIAPPYDVIDGEEQERLYAASPYNVVRLILGRQSSADTAADNRYTRAARDFAAWRRDGILQADPEPALYLLEHRFTDQAAPRARLGFIALLGLDGPMGRIAYRHEATLAAPKEDRTKLLTAVPANLEPIFCIAPDPGGILQAHLRTLAKPPPAAETVFHGETVRVWTVIDPAAIQAVVGTLADTTLLIADGHHRFEVGYAHRDRYPFLMSYFVSMEEPALRVQPIHRVLQRVDRPDPASLQALCAVEPAGGLPDLLRWLEETTRAAADVETRFGYYDGRELYRIRVLPERLARWRMAPPVPLPLAILDVSVLHGLLLPGLDGAVRYTPDAAQAILAVDRGEGTAAWLLRGVPLSQVYALAAQGLALPPKSTYFYPKVPSGLTINPWPDRSH